MRSFFVLSSSILITLSSAVCFAETASTSYLDAKMITCLRTSVANADETMTVKALKDACGLLLEQRQSVESNNTGDANIDLLNQSKKSATGEPLNIETTTVPSTKAEDENQQKAPQRRLLQDRLTMEALNRSNRFILTPHKRNFLLPVSYMDSPNREPYYDEATPELTDLNHTEAALQLSVKILLRENIFDNNGHLYLGYTNHSLWQVYNRRLSAPFRETDHQPELILTFTNDLEIFGFRNAINEVILNHESNGQPGALSRSWNRLMLNTIFEKENVSFAFNPWYRLSEKEKKDANDPKGDDNPDITDYMGYFEFTGAYKHKSDIFSIQLRNNLSGNHYGAMELSWTFPMSKTLRGYATYFNGYGHSLIDYNYHQQVVGLGIIFTDLF